MAKTQMQKQRLINDRAVKKAAAALSRTRRKSSKAALGVGGIILVLVLLAAFVTLNQFALHINGVPTWYDLFGIQKPVSDAVAKGGAKVHFIDVGQGDSELIVTEDKAVLIDCGEREYSGDVIKYIKTLGISKLNYVICTHPHSDHIGGMSDIIDEFDVGGVIMPKVRESLTPTTSSYSRLIDAVDKKDIPVQYARKGGRIALGEGSYIELLSPAEDYDDLNNYSVTARFVHGSTAFLFTGDIEKEAEDDILDTGANLRAQVIKVPHHGSNTSSSYAFVKAVRPEYAVFEVGSPNDYGHPHEETIQTYSDFGCSFLRTDMNGSIVFTTDGKTLDVETEK